jgi:hypothetical protein
MQIDDWDWNERFGRDDWQADRNNKFDLEQFGVICDRLGRVFDRSGLDRQAKPVEESAVIKHFKRARPAPLPTHRSTPGITRFCGSLRYPRQLSTPG